MFDTERSSSNYWPLRPLLTGAYLSLPVLVGLDGIRPVCAASVFSILHPLQNLYKATEGHCWKFRWKSETTQNGTLLTTKPAEACSWVMFKWWEAVAQASLKLKLFKVSWRWEPVSYKEGIPGSSLCSPGACDWARERGLHFHHQQVVREEQTMEMCSGLTKTTSPSGKPWIWLSYMPPPLLILEGRKCYHSWKTEVWPSAWAQAGTGLLSDSAQVMENLL